MDSERWERVHALFQTVAELPEAQQVARLTAECAGDAELFGEISAMIAADREQSGVLDRGIEHLAHGALNAPPPDLKEIGPYRIESVLGEGGMGIVFLAARADLQTKAAIKVLRDAWISPARRERFALEQRTLAQLEHPGIARLFDAGTLPDGTPFFVMEYVDGVSLEKFCAVRQCSVSERMAIFRSICEAVQFAHSQAVIHRDLKPSNILVKPDGTVKLLDFGISKQMDNLDLGGDMTRTGLRLMTPVYASPEQIRGERAAIQSDVYSLGVILYQLLTGRLPFDISSATPAEAASILVELDPVKPSFVARQVVQQSPPAAPVIVLPRAVWADLDVLCLTAMHKDVRKRYASTEALLRDVDHYLRGEPLEARADTLRYHAGKFVRRHKGAVAASVAVFVITVGMLMYFTVRIAAERTAALSETARTRRIQNFMMNLFQGGDKDAGPASELRVATLIERGVQEARTLDQDPEVQAELYQTLGEIYQKLGSLDQADKLLNAALGRRRSSAALNPADLSGSLVALGLLRVDQAKLDEAERLIRQGLQRSKEKLPEGHPAIAGAQDALGRVLEEKGQYSKAIPVLEEAVRLRSMPGASSADLGASLFQLANVYFYAGRYKESQTLNRRVLAIARRVYGDRHPKVAEALVNLGAIQHDTGNYVEAEKLHRQALQITESFYGERHYRTASSLTLLARALVYQKRFGEAVVLLNRAVTIQESVFGKNHPRVASAVNELGNVAAMRGHFDEAKAAFERIGDIYRIVYPGGHYLIGTAMSNLGSAYMAEKDNVRAEPLFRKAIEVYTRTLPADHLNTAIARIKLGRTLLRQKRYTEAEVEVGRGYQILNKQLSPSTSWLKTAGTDLAEIYDALQQPEKSAAFRRQITQVQSK